MPNIAIRGAIANQTKCAAPNSVLQDQVVSVDLVRLSRIHLIVLSGRVVVAVNVLPLQVASVTPVFLVAIAPALQVVVAANAGVRPIAGDLLVPATLIAARLQNPYGRVIDGQRTTTTTVTTTGNVHSNPPYLGQVPPSYQQSYPYHPQVQYEQPQQTTNIPPPHNPGTMAAGEQPPPYPAEPQGVSGGVYAPKTSYDAAPSAPPV
ncbi:hypothetical protein ACROYT_G018107 [Oculina patagonica]